MFEVRLKPGHLTGLYRRGGKVFTKNEPVKMRTVPEIIAKDPWLIVTDADAPKKPLERLDGTKPEGTAVSSEA